MAGNTKEYVLRYVAKMASNSSNNGSSNNSGTNTGGNNSGSNNQGGTGEGENNNKTNNSKADPVKIVLISVGGVLGLVLLFYLYKLIRMIIKWLKR